MQGEVLVTGGTGYIGSHTVVQLMENGYDVVIFDNLSNSSLAVLDRIATLTGKYPSFIEGDIRDRVSVQNTFRRYSINSVIHFAGLKAVEEAQEQPLKYYSNNVSGSMVLFEEMARAGAYNLVFSSSATVYGNSGHEQYREDMPLAPVNVYGRTKLMVEDILRDIKKSQPSWRIALLRYFNPVGAHMSGIIGEDPTGTANNLMPIIAQVAIGKRPKLSVFGCDYATPDGTCRRDYIHVEDLASGHLAALDRLMYSDDASLLAINLGTGRPYSVLEMVRAFEMASGKNIPVELVSRRAGDLAEYYADPTLAKKILAWEPKLSIDKICEDTWRWQKNNPNGYS